MSDDDNTYLIGNMMVHLNKDETDTVKLNENDKVQINNECEDFTDKLNNENNSTIVQSKLEYSKDQSNNDKDSMAKINNNVTSIVQLDNDDHEASIIEEVNGQEPFEDNDCLDLAIIQPNNLEVNLDQIDPSIFIHSDDEPKSRYNEEQEISTTYKSKEEKSSKAIPEGQNGESSFVGYPHYTYHPSMPFHYSYPLLPYTMSDNSSPINFAQYQQMFEKFFPLEWTLKIPPTLPNNQKSINESLCQPKAIHDSSSDSIPSTSGISRWSSRASFQISECSNTSSNQFENNDADSQHIDDKNMQNNDEIDFDNIDEENIIVDNSSQRRLRPRKCKSFLQSLYVNQLSELSGIEYSFFKQEFLTMKPKLLQCSFCDYSTHNKSNFRNHLFIHSDERLFACPHCSYKGKQSAGLRAHLKVHSIEKPYSCMYCSYKCKRKQNLVQHLRTHSKCRPYQCKFCSYGTTTKQALLKHSCRYLNSPTLNEISFEQLVAQVNSSDMHLNAENDFPVYSFNYDEFNNSKLNETVKDVSLTDSNNSFTSKGEASLQLDENEVSSTQGNVNPPRKRPTFFCPYCEFRSTRKCAMGNHIKTHAKSCYICPICSFKCKLFINFRLHLSSHLQIRNLKCGACDYEANDPDLFIDHLKSHNKSANESLQNSNECLYYQCPYCAYDCRDLSILKLHITNHSDKDFKNFDRWSFNKLNEIAENGDNQEATPIDVSLNINQEIEIVGVDSHITELNSNTLKQNEELSKLPDKKYFSRYPNGRFKSKNNPKKKNGKTDQLLDNKRSKRKNNKFKKIPVSGGSISKRKCLKAKSKQDKSIHHNSITTPESVHDIITAMETVQIEDKDHNKVLESNNSDLNTTEAKQINTKKNETISNSINRNKRGHARLPLYGSFVKNNICSPENDSKKDLGNIELEKSINLLVPLGKNKKSQLSQSKEKKKLEIKTQRKRNSSSKDKLCKKNRKESTINYCSETEYKDFEEKKDKKRLRKKNIKDKPDDNIGFSIKGNINPKSKLSQTRGNNTRKRNLNSDDSDVEIVYVGTKKKKSVSTEEKLAFTEGESVFSEGESVFTEGGSVLTKEKSVLTKEKSVLTKEKSVLTEEKSVSMEEKSVSTEGESVSTEEESVSPEGRFICPEENILEEQECYDDFIILDNIGDIKDTINGGRNIEMAENDETLIKQLSENIDSNDSSPFEVTEKNTDNFIADMIENVHSNDGSYIEVTQNNDLTENLDGNYNSYFKVTDNGDSNDSSVLEIVELVDANCEQNYSLQSSAVIFTTDINNDKNVSPIYNGEEHNNFDYNAENFKMYSTQDKNNEFENNNINFDCRQGYKNNLDNMFQNNFGIDPNKLPNNLENNSNEFQNNLESNSNEFQNNLEINSNKFPNNLESNSNKFPNNLESNSNKFQNNLENVSSKFQNDSNEFQTNLESDSNQIQNNLAYDPTDVQNNFENIRSEVQINEFNEVQTNNPNLVQVYNTKNIQTDDYSEDSAYGSRQSSTDSHNYYETNFGDNEQFGKGERRYEQYEPQGVLFCATDTNVVNEISSPRQENLFDEASAFNIPSTSPILEKCLTSGYNPYDEGIPMYYSNPLEYRDISQIDFYNEATPLYNSTTQQFVNVSNTFYRPFDIENKQSPLPSFDFSCRPTDSIVSAASATGSVEQILYDQNHRNSQPYFYNQQLFNAGSSKSDLGFNNVYFESPSPHCGSEIASIYQSSVNEREIKHIQEYSDDSQVGRFYQNYIHDNKHVNTAISYDENDVMNTNNNVEVSKNYSTMYEMEHERDDEGAYQQENIPEISKNVEQNNKEPGKQQDEQNNEEPDKQQDEQNNEEPDKQQDEQNNEEPDEQQDGVKGDDCVESDNDYEEESTKSKKSKIRYKCTKCKFSATKKCIFLAHVKTHKAKLKCPECSFICKTKKQMREHVLSHSYKCVLCNFVCDSSEGLFAHKNSAHKKKYYCTECNFKSFTVDKLNNHITVHNKILFKCKECTYETNSVLFLKFHMKKHIKDSKYLTCKDCHYVAKSQLDLSNHRSQHSSEHCQCVFCDQVFFQTSDFRDHLLRIHSIDTMAT